jgi:hypothetical protein
MSTLHRTRTSCHGVLAFVFLAFAACSGNRVEGTYHNGNRTETLELEDGKASLSMLGQR